MIRGDDKCMRSMLKNTTCYANVRDYQILHLSFLLSWLAFLEIRQLMQKTWLTLAHSRRTNSGSCPRRMPLVLRFLSPGRSKVLPTHLHAPSPTSPLLNQHPGTPQSSGRSEVLLPHFLHLADISCSFIYVVMTVLLSLKCNLHNSKVDPVYLGQGLAHSSYLISTC